MHLSKSVTIKTHSFSASSPNSVVVSSRPQLGSPTDLQLIIHLSSYPIQRLTGSGSPPPCLVTRQHPKVLHTLLLKTALLRAPAATSTTLICRVISSPSYEPIAFSFFFFCDVHGVEWRVYLPESVLKGGFG